MLGAGQRGQLLQPVVLSAAGANDENGPVLPVHHGARYGSPSLALNSCLCVCLFVCLFVCWFVCLFVSRDEGRGRRGENKA